MTDAQEPLGTEEAPETPQGMEPDAEPDSTTTTPEWEQPLSNRPHRGEEKIVLADIHAAIQTSCSRVPRWRIPTVSVAGSAPRSTDINNELADLMEQVAKDMKH